MAGSDTDGRSRGPNSGGMGWKGVAAVSLIVLAGGLILAGWLITNFDLWPVRDRQDTAVTSSNSDGVQPENNAAADQDQTTSGAGPGAGPGAGADSNDVAAKVEALEKKIAQIGRGDGSGLTYSTTPFTTNQGGVAIALRARRAIENGVPLGYIENQLGGRFGDRFPKEIDAIQKLARAPVTVIELRDDLSRNSELMIGRGGDASLWDRAKLELDELFMLRERGEPSTSPAHILQRAEENIANGDVKGAIEEVQMLAENDAAAAWLRAAQRYQNAKDALDRIERAALIAPAAPILVSPSASAPPPIPTPAPAAPSTVQDRARP